MTKYLWIGAVADKKYLTEMVSLGNNQSTAYNVQNKLIDGLNRNGLITDTISGHVVPPYPKYKKNFIKSRTWKRSNHSNDYDVSFINLPLLNILTKGIKMARAAEKWAKQNRDANKTIFVYSLHNPFLKAAYTIKKIYENTNIVVIVPDLPEFMNSNPGKLKILLKKIDKLFINKYLNYSDAFILFAEPMKTRLPINNKPFMVMEGIIGIEYKQYMNRIQEKVYNNSKNIIMFSGTLNIEEGLELLLNAFMSIQDDTYELWLTGSGNDENIILDACKKDRRIKYLGYIHSYEEFLNIQKQADLFVSMVPPYNPKSRYFFPSKIMEYLITGVPVISFALECIPNEYKEHLIFFENTDNISIANKIIEVCNMSGEIKKNMAIKRYDLLIRKTKEYIGMQILDFLNKNTYN